MNTQFNGNSNTNPCQAASTAFGVPAWLSSIFFAQLQVSYKPTAEHLSNWNRLWNKLVQKPDEPQSSGILELIESAMPTLLCSVFIQVINNVTGGQNG